MSNMFSGCRSLSCLPDISKWNIDSANDMSGMFSGCESLTFLPDISKWNISNDKYIHMNNMFSGCTSLSYFPDISKWKMPNIIKNEIIFDCCSLLSYTIFD